MDARGDYYYRLEKETFERQLVSLAEYKQANALLRDNDWLFVCPLFFQGFELKHIHSLCSKPVPHKQAINQIIFNKFFDLGWTASFIEGYCNRCDHIRPFLASIEHSLILTFQRDYEGGVKTLIPIIEGILRKYLVVEKGEVQHIQYQKIRTAFSGLKQDILTKYEAGLDDRADENKNPILFNVQQKADLLRLQTLYYEQWFEFIIDFVDNSFYLRTDQSTVITNQINRHAILHEFGLPFEYNLENYIKVYFVLQFLVWIFLNKETKSPLNEINSYRLFEKVEAYKKIIRSAEKIAYQKHVLMKNHPGYNEMLFKEKFNVKDISLPKEHRLKHSVFMKIKEALWRKGLEPQ
jgi:hypothetical protein